MWYFGEDTKELDETGRVVSTDVIWRAGVHGAAPGVVMEARPQANDRQGVGFVRGDSIAGEDEHTALVRVTRVP